MTLEIICKGKSPLFEEGVRYEHSGRVIDIAEPEESSRPVLDYVRWPSGPIIASRRNQIAGETFIYPVTYSLPQLMTGVVCVGKDECKNDKERMDLAAYRAFEILPSTCEEDGFQPGAR